MPSLPEHDPARNLQKRDHNRQRLYRTFRPSKLRDEYRALSDLAKLLALWLEIGPATTIIPGVVPVGRLAAAEELGWEPADFDQRFRELADRGLVAAEWTARLVFLPGVLAEDANGPQSSSQVIAWRRAFNELPAGDLTARIEREIRDLLRTRYVDADWLALWDGDRPSPYAGKSGKSKGDDPSVKPSKRPTTPAGKIARLTPRSDVARQPAYQPTEQTAWQPGRQQEQKQKQEQKRTPTPLPPRPSSESGSSLPETNPERADEGEVPTRPQAEANADECIAAYAEFQRAHGLHVHRVTSDQRAKVTAANTNQAELRAVLDRASRSDLLTGRARGTTWYGRGVSLSWLLDADNRAKTLAGEYDPRGDRRPAACDNRPRTFNTAAIDTPSDVWQATLAHLDERALVQRYDLIRWLQPCSLVNDHGDMIHIAAPEEFFIGWIEKYHRSALDAALADVRPGARLIFRVAGQLPAPAAVTA